MGHCEMLLAVAGLNEDQLAQRTRRLAEGEWSSFPAGEQTAYRFARKQAKSPASIRAEDIAELVKHFGPERSIDIVWWNSRCHYMTRVADAFQLPLERGNVFKGRVTPKR